MKLFGTVLILSATICMNGCAGSKPTVATASKTKSQLVEGPSIEIIESEIDLGIIPLDREEVVGEIFFFNAGSKPLQVRKVTSPCPCLLGYSGDKLLQPGDGGVLEVKLDKNQIPAGNVKRLVNIETNDPDNRVARVYFKLNVERDPVKEQNRILRTELAGIRRELSALRRDVAKVLSKIDGGKPDSQKRAKKSPDTTIYDIALGSSPVWGRPDAPVIIVEFVDFQCPYCIREYPKLKAIMKEYPDKVKVVFKHFPLGSHKKARPVHAAAQLAHIQGGSELFWKMHDMIMAKPRKLDVSNLREYAKSLNLDPTKFDEIMADADRIDALLGTDLSEARKCKVRGTPTVFINGLKLTDRSVNGYKARIDQILAKHAPPDVKG